VPNANAPDAAFGGTMGACLVLGLAMTILLQKMHRRQL
jgi:hypothetical protein